jgi:hypothetical protein
LFSIFTGMKDKRPKDINQLAKHIADIATGEVKDTISESKKKQSVKKKKTKSK